MGKVIYNLNLTLDGDHVMGMPRSVHVYRPDEPGPETPDTERRQQWVRDGRWAAWIRNDAGDMSGWHHHADNDTYVYVSRGSLTFEFGPGGAERVVAGAGDFVIVPARTIHRETTSPDADLEAFVLRMGGEPEHVNVGGPESPGS
jgi:mannose-6-phosphate isomerase-like protein (cupin superfamily)